MEIVMTRGDLEIRTFQIRSPDGHGGYEPYTEILDDIYMTVKKNSTDREYKFQKRLSNGSIIQIGEGMYQFEIQPKDTDGMGYGMYGFDIELFKEGEIKKTFVGTLTLLNEYTHAENEVRT